MENGNFNIARLQEQIEALPKSKHGRRMGISNELRMEILCGLEKSGLGIEQYCKDVGISYSALKQWKLRLDKIESKAKKPAFQKIRISADGFRVDHKIVNSERLFNLEGPRGLRLSGLSASDVATIWRTLC